MDRKLKKYEKAILNILNEYAKIRYANVDGKNELIVDKENHRYQVVTIGWEGNRFVHDCPMHFDIINGKIWVQQNMTEWEVSEMLEAQGIPKTDIVAGFLPPDLRIYSNYAVA
ncbi:MAG: XisI protein [Saprospiraceae bacterium]|nr:XisI protein [Saprospiraceae bacterium]